MMSGKMFLSKEDVYKIVAMYGTPTYVYSKERIIKNYCDFRDAFSSYPTRILYAYKANSNLSILNILRKEGAGVDALSGGDIFIAKKLGIIGEQILFTSNGKTETEIQDAIDYGVTINIDSLDELNSVIEISGIMGKRPTISFRANPCVNPHTHEKISTGIAGSKFGIHIENDLLFNAYRTAKDAGCTVAGIHSHIGSQITEIRPFVENAKKIMEFVYKLKRDLRIELNFVDLGGGLGIDYKHEGDVIPTPNDLANGIIPVIEKWNKKLGFRPTLYIEPGRRIVGDAGILLAKVLSVKKTPYKTFINVDAGFTTLLRPTMYGSYHDVVVVNRTGDEPKETYDLAGFLCESGDILAKDRLLPKVKKGDIVALLDTGAYGFSMASEYNSRPLPAEILVDEEPTLIRKRGRYEDLLRNQKF